MKKNILLLGVICILLAGCGNESESVNKDTQNKTTTSSTTSTSTTTIPTTKDMTTIKADKDHIYKSVKTGEKHKYSFIYKNQETCRQRGDSDAHDKVYPDYPYVAFDCEEIETSSGARLWGVVFYKIADENSIFYY